MTLPDATQNLYDYLTKSGYPNWLVAVGRGEDKIIVYSTKTPNKEIPKVFDGWDVVVEKSGKPVIR